MTFHPKRNRILDALKNGQVPLGVELYTYSPSIIELLAYADFDFYMLDMEHTRVNVETMDHCIRAADAAGITTVVRVAKNDSALIQQSIDSGAQGVIVPHIKNADDARKAVRSLRYAPEGTLGSCPSIRAANYSTPGWGDYLNHHSNNTSLIALLEDPEAIDNAEEIFAELKPGVDAVWFGRGDLAQSQAKYGEGVDWDHPYIMEAFEKVLKISKKTGIPTMAIPWPEANVENAKKTLEQGADICLFGIDQQLFLDQFLQISRQMKNGQQASPEPVEKMASF